ncbi:MAG: VapC toxin family PIN domain ribonuclease [Hyphomicrobiales bacterium]|nr:MAG: VapC toxin family PIN domain ribonuclease [Hyphomicrobiales bacterium]
MTLYLDTSLLITALSPEAETDTVQRWIKLNEAEGFAISDWVTAEFSAALSIKIRAGRMSIDERATALHRFSQLASRTFEKLPIGTQEFQIAARFADQNTTGLRAGDALHLAVAASASMTLSTRDKGLAKAGTSLGISTILL